MRRYPIPRRQGVARQRANAVRDRLIDRGVAANRITIVTRSKDSTGDRLRVVARPAAPDEAPPAAPTADITAPPVGEAHFASPTPMTIERGASAMVAMVRGETDGEVVYLYDAERARGNDHFAFRAVRFRNPTHSTLETGPVTVYELAVRLREVVAAHRELADLANAQTSLRARLADYKARMGELHEQLVTLQAVKTGNDLIAHLKAKMRDISDRVQKTTIAIVDHEEKIMLARVRFSDLVADL